VAATAQRHRHDDTMLSRQLQKMAILRRLSRSDGGAGNLVLRDEQRFVYIVSYFSLLVLLYPCSRCARSSERNND